MTETRKRKPPASAVRGLERAIIRVEVWQSKHSEHDPYKLANHAKGELMRLLKQLEAAR